MWWQLPVKGKIRDRLQKSDPIFEEPFVFYKFRIEETNYTFSECNLKLYRSYQMCTLFENQLSRFEPCQDCSFQLFFEPILRQDLSLNSILPQNSFIFGMILEIVDGQWLFVWWNNGAVTIFDGKRWGNGNTTTSTKRRGQDFFSLPDNGLTTFFKRNIFIFLDLLFVNIDCPLWQNYQSIRQKEKKKCFIKTEVVKRKCELWHQNLITFVINQKMNGDNLGKINFNHFWFINCM